MGVWGLRPQQGEGDIPHSLRGNEPASDPTVGGSPDSSSAIIHVWLKGFFF